MEKWNIEKWGIKFDEVNKYEADTCKILEINNSFRKAGLSEFFNQIEFRYSKVRFADKYKNKIKNSKYIDLSLNSQLTHFKGNDQTVKNAIIIKNKKSYEIKSNYFILCGGGIENSRILLWTKDISKVY